MPNGMVLMCGKMEILSIDNVLKNYKMKMKLFFRISMLALCISMSLSSFADDKKDRISVEVIDWSKNNQSLTSIVSNSNETKKIYLYAATPKKFVTVGGRYGAQPILAEVGMNFYVEKVAANDERYYIHSWVNNPTTSHETGNADYLGVKPAMDDDERIFSVANDETKKSIYLFVDRGKENRDDNEAYPSPDRVKWYIEAVNGTTNGYKIYSKWMDNQGYSDEVTRKYYLSYYQGPIEEGKPQQKFLVVTTDESKAETFYFINIQDYLNVINSQNKKYINVSGLVQDARFERNNKGIDGDLRGDYNDESKNVWQFRYNRNEDTYVFPNLQENVQELAYMTAWVGPKGDFDGQTGNYLIQKITGLKPGLYRVNCQGFYFNPNSQNDKDNTSFVFASQDYKDISNKTTLKTIEPADWDLMRPTGGPVTISDGSKAHESVDFTPVKRGYDLVVTKVFVSNKKEGEAIYTGDELVMGAVIANAGDTDIPPGEKIGIQFQMDGTTYDNGFVTWCDTFKQGLKSHETATLIANGGGGLTTDRKDKFFIATEGNHTITALVDDDNKWKEFDETNNTKDMNLIAYGLNGFKNIKIKYCVSAGKIFAESNPYEDKDVDSRKYDNSVAVLVKADKGSETGTLYIGAGKGANEGGYAFFDNFQLFYMGDKQWYLDATNTSTSEFTTTKNDNDNYHTPSGINRNPKGDNYYEYPVTYNIRRYFNVGKWESLILPCTLTGDQVKQTFGGDGEVKLSVFDRVEGTCVYFRAVDPDNEGIVAGKPYIIKVGKEADIKTKNDEYTFPWGNNTTVKVKGPIYQVKGVVPPTFTGDGVTTEETTSGGYKVQFHGFYYDPGAAPANAYVINNGDMYHLSSDWNSFVGTSWYVTITDAQGNAKALSFSFDGDSSTTAIENVAGQEDAAVQTDGFVYNLSGQRVGTRNNMSNLSSGIYIVGGKKVVVK